MSLIHWWPLNGNWKDLGLGNTLTITNRSGSHSFETGGKLAASSLKLGSGDPSFTNPFVGLDTWSFAFWYKANTPGQWTDIFTFSGGYNRIEFHQTNGAGLTWYADNSTYGQTFTSGTALATGLSNNTWYHICVVFDNRKSYFYLNGKSNITPQTGKTKLTSDGDDKIYLGSRISTSYCNCNIQDIRCYDHALSAKEVKEISRGLVLHHIFDDYCQANLYTSDCPPTISPNGDTISAQAYSTTAGCPTGRCRYVTISKLVNGVYCSMPNGSMSNGSTYTLTVYYKIESTNSSQGTTVVPRHEKEGTCLFQKKTYLANGWIKYVRTYTFNSAATYGALVFYNSSPSAWGATDATSGITLYIGGIKVELGTASTYYSLGNADTTITDVSGYGNHSTPYDLVVDSETAIGTLSGKFNSSSTYIGTVIPQSTIKNFGSFTFNVWAYAKSFSNYRGLFGYHNSGGNGGIVGFQYSTGNISCSIVTATPSYKSVSFTAPTSNEWHMYTMTVSSTALSVYLDGTLKGTVAITLSTDFNPIGNIIIGKAHNSTDRFWNGYIADFKIYATALSAEDILAEYQRKAAIDKNGNLITGEFIETEGSVTKIDKNNFVDSNLFATTMTLEDGSLWVPICVHYVPDGLNTSRSNKYCYTSRNIWNTFGIINDAERPESGYYEFYVMQQTSVNGDFSWFRFKQNINPFSATWNDVNPSKVGTNVIRVSASTTNGYAGMYWMNSSAAMCFANGSNGNWYGCGIQTAYQGGIPGYNGQTVLGWQIVYMRITKTCAKMFKNGLVIANNIIEN